MNGGDAVEQVDAAAVEFVAGWDVGGTCEHGEGWKCEEGDEDGGGKEKHAS